MDTRKAQYLLQKHRDGTITPEEKKLLDTWYVQYGKEQFLPEEAIDAAAKKKELFARLNKDMTGHPVRSIWPRVAAAASILVALSTVAYLYLKQPKTQEVAQLNPEQIAPLQKGVVLTLGQGKQVQLTNKHNGRIASLGVVNIDQADSALHYSTMGTGTAAPEINTLTNNGNSKFSVKLADGSVVRLDIGSSLSYPTAFNTATHKVSLKGQAYFKVKHVPGQRFLVSARGQITEDIGTVFNINAYDDEPVIRTTLLEGSIKVNEKVLKPGEQAIVNGSNLNVAPADIEEVTAWMQDKIVLEKQTLETILRKVSRIYGVQFVYIDNEVRDYTYGGAVNTSTKLSSVLNFLMKAGGVDFKVEGKQIKVFKKKK